MKSYEKKKQYIEQELYIAIQALEDDNLAFARASTDRAKTGILEAWHIKSAGEPTNYITLDDET